MKRKYIAPWLELLQIDQADIITTSGDPVDPGGDNAGGWDDENGTWD